MGVIKISLDGPFTFNDLVMHCFGYLVLMCSAFLCFPSKTYTFKLFTALLLFSFLIECVQYFIPYRSFSMLDMLANFFGLVLGIGLGWLLLPIFKQMYKLWS
jgi:VanZ family protein